VIAAQPPQPFHSRPFSHTNSSAQERTAPSALLLLATLSASACQLPATSPGGQRSRCGSAYSAWPRLVSLEGPVEEKGLFDAGRRSVHPGSGFDGLPRFESTRSNAGHFAANSQTPGPTRSFRLLVGATAGGAHATDNSTGNDQVMRRRGISSVADAQGQVGRVARKARSTHYLLLSSQAGRPISAMTSTFVPLDAVAAAAAFVAAPGGCRVACLAPSPPRPSKRSGSTKPCSLPRISPERSAITWSAGPNSWRQNPEQLQNVVERLVRHPREIKAQPESSLAINGRTGRCHEAESANTTPATTSSALKQSHSAFRARRHEIAVAAFSLPLRSATSSNEVGLG